MENYILIQAVLKQLPSIKSEEKVPIVTELIKQCEQLNQYSISNQMLSKNEEFEDLNEEQLACLLSNFLVGKVKSDYLIAREQRFVAVQGALDSMKQFIDLLIILDLFSENEIKLMQNELDPAKTRDVKRQLIQDEEKAKKLSQQQFEKLLSNTCQDIKLCMQNAVIAAKFEAIRELRFLEEEFLMLEFEKNQPVEAENALKERQIYQLMNEHKKIQMVQMDENLVNRVKNGGKFVPLDTVELMKLEESKKQEKKEHVGGDLNTVIGKQTQVNLNQKIDWEHVDLAYGGGNPDTDKYYDKEYRVVRTDTFYPGQEDPEPEINWRDHEEVDMIQEGKGEDEEDYDEGKIREKRDWDDWKDQHPTGQGNKRRMV